MTLEEQVLQNDVKLKKLEDRIRVLQRLVTELIHLQDKFTFQTQNKMINLIER
jgi:hypothetical protein